MGKNRREAALKAWKTKRERKASQERLGHIVNCTANLVFSVGERIFDILFGENPVEIPKTEKEPKKEVPPRERLPKWMIE